MFYVSTHVHMFFFSCFRLLVPGMFVLCRSTFVLGPFAFFIRPLDQVRGTFFLFATLTNVESHCTAVVLFYLPPKLVFVFVHIF